MRRFSTKKQLNSLRIAKKAILALFLGCFTFSSAFCPALAENKKPGMVGILDEMNKSAVTPAPMVSPMEAPIDTLITPIDGDGSILNRRFVPGDNSVRRLEKQPETVSRGVRLYTLSAWLNNLHLNPATLSIPQDGMPIPLLYQYDYTTVVCYSGNSERSAGTSGCGTTVVSMLDAYINGNYDQTPYTVLYDAARDGLYAGTGLDYYVIFDLVKSKDIEIECRERSVDSMREALRDGHPLILRMGPGTFTQAGHYILVRGLDADGNALVNDPNSEEHSHMSFPLEQLNEETKSDDMFVILSKPKVTQ